MPKVSVIVPIWNVEKYLPKCLDSLVNQTLKDIEIICINDGSSDNCLNILKEYQAKDDRIVVIDQENRGQGNARNSGLKVAKGEYIMFCDSDDYYDINMCEKMYSAIVENDCDLAVCEVNFVLENDNPILRKIDNSDWYKLKYNGFKIVNDSILFSIPISACIKIYVKSKIDKYSIFFPDKLLQEDRVFMYKYLSICENVFFLKEKLYYRLIRVGSTYYNIKNRKVNSYFDCVESINDLFVFLDKNLLLAKKNDLFFHFFLISLNNCDKKYLKLSDIVKVCNILRKNKSLSYEFYDLKPNSYQQYIINLIKNRKYIMLLHVLKNSPEYQTKYNLKLFDLISLFKIKEYSDKNKSIKKKFYILSIPFIKIIKKDKKTYIKLFNFIPLLKVNSNIVSKKTEINIQNNYKHVLERIKNKVRNGGKVRVAFLISTRSKWVYQDFYSRLKNSGIFEPIILIQYFHTEDINKTYDFFKLLNMKVEYAYLNGKNLDLSRFEPDIIFYQQRFFLDKKQDILTTSRFSLACHIHYGTCLSTESIERGEYFYKNLYINFIISKELKSEYQKCYNGLVSNLAVVGHPKFDVYYCYKGNTYKKYVIYAPHHSLKNDLPRCATFDKNGLEILEFAKNHPEFSWTFKPHPRFKYAVVHNSIMEQDEIEDYYNEWAKIGMIHTDGNYFDIFKQARCMITDSISFLTEFLPTRQPVIHLRSKNAEEYDIMSKRIIDHYYAVYNNNELQKYLNMVLIEDKDPKKNERIEVLENLKLCESNASDNIINYLKKVIGI